MHKISTILVLMTLELVPGCKPKTKELQNAPVTSTTEISFSSDQIYWNAAKAQKANAKTFLQSLNLAEVDKNPDSKAIKDYLTSMTETSVKDLAELMKLAAQNPDNVSELAELATSPTSGVTTNGLGLADSNGDQKKITAALGTVGWILGSAMAGMLALKFFLDARQPYKLSKAPESTSKRLEVIARGVDTIPPDRIAEELHRINERLVELQASREKIMDDARMTEDKVTAFSDPESINDLIEEHKKDEASLVDKIETLRAQTDETFASSNESSLTREQTILALEKDLLDTRLAMASLAPDIIEQDLATERPKLEELRTEAKTNLGEQTSLNRRKKILERTGQIELPSKNTPTTTEESKRSIEKFSKIRSGVGSLVMTGLAGFFAYKAAEGVQGFSLVDSTQTKNIDPASPLVQFGKRSMEIWIPLFQHELKQP